MLQLGEFLQSGVRHLLALQTQAERPFRERQPGDHALLPLVEHERRQVARFALSARPKGRLPILVRPQPSGGGPRVLPRLDRTGWQGLRGFLLVFSGQPRLIQCQHQPSTTQGQTDDRTSIEKTEPDHLTPLDWHVPDSRPLD